MNRLACRRPMSFVNKLTRRVTYPLTINIKHHERFNNTSTLRSSVWETANTVSYFVGKSVILFTMFYCTLNWAHYRNLRKRMDDTNDDGENKK